MAWIDPYFVQKFTEVHEWLQGNKYLYAFSIFLGFFLLSEAIVIIIEKIVMKFVSKTNSELDDKLIHKINKPLSILLLLFGIRLGTIVLELNDIITKYSDMVLMSIIAVIGTYIIVAIASTALAFWGEKYAKKTKSDIDDHIVNLGAKFFKVLGFVIAVLLVMSVWGIEIGPLLAGLGIGGIAVAFALQSTLGNIFGGISLILDKTFKVGDIVKLESGQSGTIYDVGLRATKVKTWDNDIVTVPNGKLADSIIQNVSQPNPQIRATIPFGVAYGSDPTKVKKVVLKELKKIEHVMDDPAPWVWFMEMADSALNFQAFFYVDDLSNKWPTQQIAIEKIYKALKKAKISIPFPQMDVHLDVPKKGKSFLR